LRFYNFTGFSSSLAVVFEQHFYLQPEIQSGIEPEIL
jgi:hypothetical protein